MCAYDLNVLFFVCFGRNLFNIQCFLEGAKKMGIKKFFKKLSAIIIGLCFVTGLTSSAVAISPVELSVKIEEYQDKASVLNDYDSFIKPNLLENGFDISNVITAENFLNKEAQSNPDKGISKFKNYVSHRLSFAQSEIFMIVQDIENEVSKLEENGCISSILEILKKNSNILPVKKEMENIELYIKNCRAVSKISLMDSSLKYVQQQQQEFYKNYSALNNSIRSALNHINTFRANQQKNQASVAENRLNSDFANAYSGMVGSSMYYGFSCLM